MSDMWELYVDELGFPAEATRVAKVPAFQSREFGGGRWVEHGGRRLRLSELARANGIAPNTLKFRLRRGWEPWLAATRPVAA